MVLVTIFNYLTRNFQIQGRVLFRNVIKCICPYCNTLKPQSKEWMSLPGTAGSVDIHFFFLHRSHSQVTLCQWHTEFTAVSRRYMDLPWTSGIISGAHLSCGPPWISWTLNLNSGIERMWPYKWFNMFAYRSLLRTSICRVEGPRMRGDGTEALKLIKRPYL